MKHPLVIPTLLYVGGILLGDWLPLPVWWLFAGGFMAAGLALSCPRARDWALGALLVGAGWTNQVLHTSVLSPRDLRLQFEAPALVTVRGRLTETPYQRVFDRGEQETWHTIAQVEVTSILRQHQAWQPASGGVAVRTPGILPGRFCGGCEVEIVGVLQPPGDPVAPGAFDYRTYLRRQGIYFQLRTLGTNDWQLVAAVAGGAPPPSVVDRFGAWAQRTLARGLPAEDEPLRLLWTMTLGWKAGLTNELSQPFMRSGTMHIFAVSGLHIALIAGMLVAVLRVLQVPRRVCGLLVIPLIWFYTGLTGWQASAIRSTVMMTIIILGWSLERPSDLLNSLALAAFAILLWDPQQIFQASFQLSFFCVLSLALFAGQFQRIGRGWLAPDPLLPDELRPRWQRCSRRALYWLAASLATSLAACLGSIPLIAYYFNLFNPVALLSNIVIVPLSSFALMSSLASLVVGAWAPALCELFNHAAWFFMWLMIRASEWFAALPGAWCYVRAPSSLQFALYYGTLISLTAGWLAKPRLRVWVGAGLLLLGLACAGQWLAMRPETRVTVLPLRGGHAVFCAAPESADVFLRDCGDDSATQFVTQPFLKHEGVNRLPAFLLSHGDVRQIGGATNILCNFPPRQLITSPLRFRSPNYRSLFDGESAGRPPHRVVQRGERLGHWQVLHPDAGDAFSQADDNALVLHGDFGGVRLLLLSDLGRRGQELLRQRYPDLRADIIVTGLPTQGEPLHDSLIQLFQPRLIILADSEFPATRRAPPRLRERLAGTRIPTFYTRETSAVQIRLRHGKFTAFNASGQVLMEN